MKVAKRERYGRKRLEFYVQSSLTVNNLFSFVLGLFFVLIVLDLNKNNAIFLLS